jgi:GDP-D-mannose 3',5'-epimerase
MLGAAIRGNVRKFVYTSSACVYSPDLQRGTPVPLHETLALPLNPERGYGWEKLFSEQLCDYASSSSVLRTEVARLFNVYGPHGSWCDGREKAPAAICRKVAEAAHIGSRQIEVWGSGAQVRSFLYIDDCITGLISLADAGYAGPVNLASTELATITEFVQVVASVAGVDIEPRFDETRPIGAHARVPDTTRAQRELKWRPTVSLRDGIEVLYPWIYEQVSKRHAYQSAARSFQAPANA